LLLSAWHLLYFLVLSPIQPMRQFLLFFYYLQMRKLRSSNVK
jgi:hypothetical protein